MNKPPPFPELAALPYHDTKPRGAPDFYFAINATFRFVAATLGHEALIKYWSELGRDYMKPVWERWRRLGLDGIASYWRAFFLAEPGGEAEVRRLDTAVVLEIRTCPAIRHLREHGRVIFPEFCRHCYHIGESAAREAGYTVRVEGGDGSCRQTFSPANLAPGPQDLNRISLC